MCIHIEILNNFIKLFTNYANNEINFFMFKSESSGLTHTTITNSHTSQEAGELKFGSCIL